MEDKATIEASIKALQARREELFALQKPINEELTTNYDKLDTLKTELGKHLLAEGKGDDLGWMLNLKNRELSMDIYYALQNKMMPYGLYMSGHHPSTNQAAFSITLDRDGKNAAKIEEGIRLLTPFYTPIDGWVRFHILEYTCSAYRPSPDFWVKPDCSQAAVVEVRSYRDPETKFTGTIPEALTWMRKHRLFSSSTSSEDEEEQDW